VLAVPVVDTPPEEAVSAPSAAEKTPPAPRVERKPRGKKASVNAATYASETRADTGSQGIRIEHKQDVLSIDPLLLTAYQAYKAGDLKVAEQQYREVLRKDAQGRNTPNRDALLGLADIAQQQSQDALAAQYYGQVLAQDPRDPQANAGMLALRGASDGGMSESRLKTLLVQHPESAALHFSLGNQYAEQMRWNEAQQAYFNAYSLAPDSAQFAFNLAVSLDHLGQRKLAAQHYQRALQLDSGRASFDHAHTQKRLHDLTVAP
jgi:tetratricopeptide (TPR) repeat protein